MLLVPLLTTNSLKEVYAQQLDIVKEIEVTATEVSVEEIITGLQSAEIALAWFDSSIYAGGSVPIPGSLAWNDPAWLPNIPTTNGKLQDGSHRLYMQIRASYQEPTGETKVVFQRIEINFNVVNGEVSTINMAEPLEIHNDITISPAPVPLNGQVDITIGESITGLQSAVIWDLMLEKPSGEQVFYDLPVDITNDPETIHFPSEDWSSTDGIVIFNEAGMWQLFALIEATYKDGSNKPLVIQQSVIVSFNVLPEFIATMLAVATPLATLSIYLYRKRGNNITN